MGTLDMFLDFFKEKQTEKRPAPTGVWAFLVSFVWYGFLVSVVCAFFFLILAGALGGNFLTWLAIGFGLLTVGQGVTFALTRFERYPFAAGVVGVTWFLTLLVLLLGAGIGSAALGILLLNLLSTLGITYGINYYRRAGKEKLESSELMIAIGRLENDVDVMRATLDSLEEGLLVADVQDRVLRYNRRLPSLLGLRSEAGHDPKELATVNDWMAQIRSVASNPDDFRASIQNARELVRRGETSVFVFGIEKPNPRYRPTEQVAPRLRLPEGEAAADSGPTYGRNEPLLSRDKATEEPETLFERDTRPLLYREMKLTVFPLIGPKGHTLGVCYLARDVTEERELEQIKDNFISIVSHEVRTPMAVILGLTELLALPNIDKAEQEEWLKAINQEALRLRTVLNDMQSISRIKDGALELTLEDVDLRELIERVAKVSKLQYRASHDAEIEFDIDQSTIYTDRGKLTQVLTNLIGNAIKYTPEGTAVKIRVGTRPNHLGEIYISVTDQGIGIPKSEQHKVFSRFFRSTNTRQKGIGGTGLGLAITQNLVKLMGGTIWFESEENKGSTFYFSLPTNEPSPHLLDEPTPGSGSSFKF
jgi:two-component sensor histidine kinase/PAS domain-containing protein